MKVIPHFIRPLLFFQMKRSYFEPIKKEGAFKRQKACLLCGEMFSFYYTKGRVSKKEIYVYCKKCRGVKHG